MPRTLKRRSEVLNEHEDVSDSPEPAARRQRRSSSISSASSSNISLSPDPDTQAQSQANNTQILTKKLVRLALSTEYARLPLRRSDISQKILKDNNASHKLFKPVFNEAQKILQHTFGMTMIELPSKEKTTLKDRRAQATQTQSKSQTGSSAGSNKSWILVSTLPDAFKRNAAICPPNRAPTQDMESEYTALYTFVLSLIYLNNSVLTDAKLERYLKRVNADTYTPSGATDKLLQKMAKDGYIEKRRDTSSGEEIVEWVVGPRGKIEVGVKGVANLVKGVYGFGANKTSETDGVGDEDEPLGAAKQVKIEEDELNKRLERSLGLKMSATPDDSGENPQQLEVNAGNEQQAVERPRRSRRRRQDDEETDD